MKENQWKHQGTSIIGMFALFVAASQFDQWVEAIRDDFSKNFYFELVSQRLWALPVVTLLLAILALTLYRTFIKQNNRFTALLFLISGTLVLFYPTLVMTFGRPVSWLPMPMYFSNSTFFNVSAWIAAIGLHGIIVSAKRTPKE